MSAEDKGRFWVSVDGPLHVAEVVTLELHYLPPSGGLQTGGNLWFFFDIRQLDEWVLTFESPDSIAVRGPAGSAWAAEALVGGGVVRTFDIHSPAPEFLHVVHAKCVEGAVAAAERVSVKLWTAPDGFLLPRNAIDAFRFWLVEDPAGELTFYHPERDKHHYFLPRDAKLSLLESNPLTIKEAEPAVLQVTTPSHTTGEAATRVVVTDRFGNPVRDAAGVVTLRAGSGKTTAVFNSFSAEAKVPVRGPIDRVTASYRGIEAASNPVRVVEEPPPFTLFWGAPTVCSSANAPLSNTSPGAKT